MIFAFNFYVHQALGNTDRTDVEDILIGKEEVSEKEIQTSFKPKADNLIYAFHNPDLRETLEQYRKDTDQLIDDSPDKIDHAGTGYDVEKAEGLINNWQQFIKDHQNDLDAIQLIYPPLKSY